MITARIFNIAILSGNTPSFFLLTLLFLFSSHFNYT
jgi:hypothetical protein